MGYSKKHGVAVSGPWLPIPLEFLRSRACAELSPLAAKLLFDVLATLGPNATGNGDISLAPKLMAIRGWKSRSSLGAAAQELIKHGLLHQTRDGKKRLDCRLFACTLYPISCNPKKVEDRGFLTSDFMGSDANLGQPPTETKPANWRHTRKGEVRPATGQTLAPYGDELVEIDQVRPATGQTPKLKTPK